MEYKEIFDKYYPTGSAARQILFLHSSQVTGKAIDIATNKALDINIADIITAGMLHDIGIVRTDAPDIFCFGDEPYIRHGIIGGYLLRHEGMPEWVARVAERHTGAGLTVDEIIAEGLPLPHRDYLPETLLEQLICYADKFYSKGGDMQEKSLDRVISSMRRFGQPSLDRFMHLHSIFS